MPVIASTYNPPILWKNGHFSTIYAGLWRKINNFQQQRERLELPDGDFLDLDWSFSIKPTKKVIILIHGLEGNGQRSYITGSAKQFNANGYDACALNLRGCSGQMNRLYPSYHSGASHDLEMMIDHLMKFKKYDEIYLKGFSLGGNLLLKYLGEQKQIPPAIKAAIAVSVPCSLHDSLQQLMKTKNILYAQRFKKNLIKKLKEKQRLFPDKITDTDIEKVMTLKDFDDIYTSRAHGFKNALDYYEQCSCIAFLPCIKVPTLLLNAKNDSFLGAKCYPIVEAEKNPYLHLEIPKYGGHVGFFGKNNSTYTEKRAIKFIRDVL